MKYGFIFVVGGLAAFASLRRFLKSTSHRRATAESVSDRWLLTQRGDEQ